MCIYHSPYTSEGQQNGANFMIHPNYPYTWDPLNYYGSIEFSLIQMDLTVGSRINFLFNLSH